MYYFTYISNAILNTVDFNVNLCDHKPEQSVTVYGQQAPVCGEVGETDILFVCSNVQRTYVLPSIDVAIIKISI